MTRSAEINAGMRAALHSRAGAWRFVTDFAADWRAPLTASDGYDIAALDAAEQRLGVPLPAALREAYMLLGRRDDLLRNQDRLLRPEDLYVDEAALVYHTENQGAAEWGILLTDTAAEDPATYYRLDLADKTVERWEPWTQRLSVALVELVMAETALYEDDGLSDGTELPDGALDAFEQLPTVVPEQHESTWYLGPDVLLHLSGGWLTARARTAAALEGVREAVLGDWVNW